MPIDLSPASAAHRPPIAISKAAKAAAGARILMSPCYGRCRRDIRATSRMCHGSFSIGCDFLPFHGRVIPLRGRNVGLNIKKPPSAEAAIRELAAQNRRRALTEAVESAVLEKVDQLKAADRPDTMDAMLARLRPLQNALKASRSIPPTRARRANLSKNFTMRMDCRGDCYRRLSNCRHSQSRPVTKVYPRLLAHRQRCLTQFPHWKLS